MIIQPHPEDGQSQAEADARYLKLSGGTLTGGLDFAGPSVANALDFSRGIEVYPGMGISVTDASLNIAVNDSARKICFVSGSLGAVVVEFSYYEGLTVLYDHPVTAKSAVIDGVQITGAAAPGQVLTATDATHATWAASETTAATIGDVKHGFQPGDHGGWLKLDGRATSTLTEMQQAAAASLGFTESLPDATDATLMQGMAALGSVSGSNNRTLIQANLPDISLASSSDGDHYHAMMAVTNDAGVCGFSEMLAPDAYPATKVWSRQSNTATGNNANLAIVGRAMENSGPHTHTVPLGGSGTPLDITPKSMAVNTFVFLGE